MSVVTYGILLAIAIAFIANNWKVFHQSWIYIPGIYTYFMYPITAHKPVTWIIPEKHADKQYENKPNIVLIVVDDMGINDITAYKGGFFNGRIQTPHIDSIGIQGALFHNAYAGHATCAPSRAALLTGRYGSKMGYEFTPISPVGGKVLGTYGSKARPGVYHPQNSVGVDYDNMTLPEDTMTIPKALRSLITSDGRSAYRNIQIGKWHLGTKNSSRPTSQGFDESLGVGLISRFLPMFDPREKNCYLGDLLDDFLWANVRYEIRRNTEQYMQPRGYFTDYIGDEAAKVIKANKDHPFFLYLAHIAVHSPLQALIEDYDTLDGYSDMTHCEKVYGAMLIALDRSIGTVLKALEENGISDNTIVMFTSDNGAASYAGQRLSNAPYRGWKATFFQGDVRTPMMMKWPHVIPPGTHVRDTMVSHIDIFPTIMDAAGINISNSVDGYSMLPPIAAAHAAQMKHEQELVAQEKGQRIQATSSPLTTTTTAAALPQERHLFFRSGHYKALIRRGRGINNEYVIDGSSNDTIPIWKIQVSGNPPSVWLHDLLSDPYEHHNLAKPENLQKQQQQQQQQHQYSQYTNILDRMQALLVEENSHHALHPIWESRSETAVPVDKIAQDPEEDTDEWIYWPN